MTIVQPLTALGESVVVEFGHFEQLVDQWTVHAVDSERGTDDWLREEALAECLAELIVLETRSLWLLAECNFEF